MNEKVFTYIVKVDPAINHCDQTIFFNRVQTCLKSSYNWPGTNFIYVGEPAGYYTADTPAPSKYKIIITLLARSTKHKLLELTNAKLSDQPNVDGYGNKLEIETLELSYTFSSTPTLIVIDYDNWQHAHEKLSISKEDYESYVIYHEIGHAIGHSHRSIPQDISKPYPIMYQATLGLPDVSRFKPYPNESDDL